MVKRKAEAVDENEGGAASRRRSGRQKASKNEALAVPIKSSPVKSVPKPPKGKDTAKARTINPSPKSVKLPKADIKFKASSNGTEGEQQFWLMKAEPESRIEKGQDIKFSVDDLASKTAPEPWDGIRNPVARNNLRAMKKGDLAFFYHSSCKVPAIVGIMEIVAEHSPDLSAQNPKAPYYDPKDADPEKPKWSVVHVEFRSKLKEPITLKELRAFGEKGGKLEGMQMLRQSRLSVSKVSKEEWEFLMGIVRERDDVDL